jgi:hypothetical protein
MLRSLATLYNFGHAFLDFPRLRMTQPNQDIEGLQ